MTYKLYLSKSQTRPTFVTPFRWMMRFLVEPLLKNVTYYRVDDTWGNLVIEVEVTDAQVAGAG